MICRDDYKEVATLPTLSLPHQTSQRHQWVQLALRAAISATVDLKMDLWRNTLGQHPEMVDMMTPCDRNRLFIKNRIHIFHRRTYSQLC